MACLAIFLRVLSTGCSFALALPLHWTLRTTSWPSQPSYQQGKRVRLPAAPVYHGPEGDELDMVASIEVEELGLVLEVGGSAVAPGSLGLFARLAPGVDHVELPALSLLGGYARGSFSTDPSGDKTVGFALASAETAVFFERELVTVREALAAVADRAAARNRPVALAGHDVGVDGASNSTAGLMVRPTADAAAFPRYFVPDGPDETVHHTSNSIAVPVIGATNLGVWCNDRAFKTESALGSEVEYRTRAAESNCVQLIWRLAWDEESGELQATWPLSVLSRDVRFENAAPMELGTTYGWRYWQATVHDPDLSDNTGHSS